MRISWPFAERDLRTLGSRLDENLSGDVECPLETEVRLVVPQLRQRSAEKRQ